MQCCLSDKCRLTSGRSEPATASSHNIFTPADTFPKFQSIRTADAGIRSACGMVQISKRAGFRSAVVTQMCCDLKSWFQFVLRYWFFWNDRADFHVHAAQIFMNEIKRAMAGSVMTGPVCIIVCDFYNSSLSGGNARRSPTLCLSASTRLAAASEEQ